MLTAILDDHALILLVLSQLLPNLLSFLLLTFLHLTYSFLPAFHLFLFTGMLAIAECVRLEEVKLVAGGHNGKFVERIDGPRLIGLQLGQLVQRPPCLFYLGL